MSESDVIENFKTWCRDQGKYNLTTLNEILEAYKEYDRTHRSVLTGKSYSSFESIFNFSLD